MTLVIKIGGEVVGSGEAVALAADLRTLIDEGARVAIVHGGGPQASALSKQLGIVTTQVAGRRVTDLATLDVMKMTIAGKLNVDLCAILTAAGVRVVGLHNAVHASRRAPSAFSGSSEIVDLGLVGDVTGFDTALLDLLWSAGYTPVLACLGADASGNVYNINADTVANQLAATLSADRLFLVTSAPGVLRDLANPSSRIPQLTRVEARAAIADGTVRGGMIPKLEEAIEVVDRGVGAIHILGKLAPSDLVRAVRHPGSVGTTLVP